MSHEFVGAAVPLTDQDIADAAAQLGIEVAAVRAVDEVESLGDGFLDDGRPTILFERHVFGRRTGHRFSAMHPDISGSSPGGYGADGAHQYERLAEAIALDRTAALQSASWGRYQVMGFNAELCGWPDVEDFVASMRESEALHLKAFIGYCRATNLVRFLAVRDWRSFARGYNGPGNVDEYSQKLAVAYRKHAAASPPILATDPTGRPVGEAPISAVSPVSTIKRIQEALGVVSDGDFGPISRRAFNAVLRAAGQPGI